MSYPETFRTKPLVAFVALALGAPTLVLAADADPVVLDTVEVIATTPLHSSGVSINQVPSNVQVVKGKAIQEQQSLGLSDYLADNLLGVNVNETQNNPFQPDVNFHGFAASPLLGTPQGLSVYQDGVRVNEPFGDTVNWDLIPKNAIAGINLMPGSNPLFGLNTLGGALSIQTKSGDLFPGGAVQVYGGSWGRRAAEAEFGGSAANGANYYVAANLFKEDGWRDNSKSDVRQLFGKFGWKGEKTDFSVSFAGADNDLYGNGFAPESFLKTFGRSSVYTQPDNTKNKLGFVTGQFNHWFSDELALNAVAYYRHTRAKTYNADINGNFTAPGVDEGVINQTSSRQNAYGITGQLSWTTEKNLFIAGAGYDRAKIDFTQTSQIFAQFDAARGMNVAAGFVDPNPVLDVDLSGKTHTWSVFATDTYNLTSKLALTASGRYNRTQVENTDHINAPTDLAYLGGSQTFHRFNPAVGLTFTPVASLNFFGGYNEGSRAPSSIEIGCSNPDAGCNLPNAMAGDPPVLKQVVAKTWEGGVRGNLSNSVKWSVAAYHTENDNDIQFISSPTTPTLGYFTNVGQTRRVGLDVGLDGKAGAFRWLAGYSFVRATYESDFDVVAPANSTADINGVINVKAGDRIPGIPQHQLKLRGEYSVLPNWTIGANLLAFSSQYLRGNENNADANGKVGGYAVLNLDTRYTVGKSGWQVFAKANNVFDKEYASGGMLGENAFNAAGTFTGANTPERFLAPSAPRAGWIGLRYEFGGAKSSKVDVD